jgi:dienelactone hydrolase
VHATLIERDLDLIPRGDACARAERPDECRRGGLRTGLELFHGPVVTDILGQLSHLVGHGLPSGDREVDENQRAERFAEGCAFADELRQAGHTVHTPDLFDGRTFETIEEGMDFAREAGFGTLAEHGVAAADGIGSEAVYAGFSFGVMAAQQLAQTRPGARGALLMSACLPVSEFGEAWPEGLSVQVHGKDADPFFAEDLEAAQALVHSTDRAELFLYPGQEHLFADSSLPDYDAAAAALLTERVLAFLDMVQADKE